MLSHHHASSTIQRAWRSTFRFRKLSTLVKLFHYTYGINIDNVKYMGATATAEFVRDAKRTAAAFRLAKRIWAIACVRRQPAEELTTMISPKKLILAYLIAHYPAHAFAEMHPLEQALLRTSMALVKQIDRITTAVRSTDNFCARDLAHDLTQPFNKQLIDYAECFDKWRAYDGTKQTNRISNALFSLYSFVGNTPSAPHYAPILSKARADIHTLRQKLASIRGNDALPAFDAELAALPQAEFIASAGADPMVEMAPPHNEYIVHELLVDPAYRYTNTGSNAAHETQLTINVAFHELYWSMLQTDLASAKFTRAADLFMSIRDAVITTSPTARHDDFMTKLETNAIVRHIQLNTMTVNKLVCFTIATHAFLDTHFDIPSTKRAATAERVRQTFGVSLPDTPAEDVELIRRWDEYHGQVLSMQERPDVLVKGLRVLYDLCRGLRVRYINKRIVSLVPIVQEQGYDYEAGKFKANKIPLDKTRAWLARELRDMPPAVRNAPLPLVHAHAFIALIAHDKFIYERVPETMRLDATRLAYLHAEFHALIKTRLLVIVSTEAGKTIAAIHAMRPGIFPPLDTFDLPPDAAAHFDHSSRPHQITHSRTHAMLVAYLTDLAAPVARFLNSTPNVPADVAEALNARFAQFVALARRTAEISIAVHGKRYAEMLAEMV